MGVMIKLKYDNHFEDLKSKAFIQVLGWESLTPGIAS